MPNIANPRNTAYTREEIERAIVAAGDAGDMEAVRELGMMLPETRPQRASAPLAQSARGRRVENAAPKRTGVAALMLGANDPRGAGEQLAAGAGDIVEGAGDILGLAVNPVGQMFYNAIGRNETYDTGQILREASGLPDNPNRMQSAINQGAAAAFVPAAGARQVAQNVAAPVARNALQTIGRNPIADAIGGGAAGAALEATSDANPLLQFGGALAAGILAQGAAQRIGRSIAGRGPVDSAAQLPREFREPTPRSLADDARDLDVRLLPASTGGTLTKMATGGARVTLGEIPIAAAARRSVESLANARGQVAEGIGEAAEGPIGAGQIIRRQLNDWAQKTGEGEGNRVQQLFEAVPIPADTNMELSATRGALQDLTEGFKSNKELSQIWANDGRLRATLEALTPQDIATPARARLAELTQELQDAQQQLQVARNGIIAPGRISSAQQRVDDLQAAIQVAQREAASPPVGGQLSWSDASRLRSTIGEIIDQPGLAAEGNTIQKLRRFYAALTQDMEATAAQTSPRALTMWRRAVQYKRGRENRINNVITDILGNRNQKSDEQVFAQINRWASQSASGDNRSLARTLRSMNRDEADVVRATILSRMGNAKKGRQNAEGDVFSPSEFMTQWNGLEPKARAMLFPDRQHRGDVQKLVRLMDAAQNADQYANTSKTALAGNMTAGGVLLLFDQALAVGLGTISSLAFGKLLSSNRLAQALARPPKSNSPAAMSRYFERLRGAASPETLPIVIELEKSTMRAVNDNAANITNAVANDEQD